VQTPRSFDHLVGAGDERWRHFEGERLGGGQIDDEVELRRLLDRNVAWLRPAQNLVIGMTDPVRRSANLRSAGMIDSFSAPSCSRQ
jgi:hypothetical protein